MNNFNDFTPKDSIEQDNSEFETGFNSQADGDYWLQYSQDACAQEDSSYIFEPSTDISPVTITDQVERTSLDGDGGISVDSTHNEIDLYLASNDKKIAKGKMTDSIENIIDIDASLDYDVNRNSQETTNWKRVEVNCDRESTSFAWGLWNSETIDCDNKAKEPDLEVEDS